MAKRGDPKVLRHVVRFLRSEADMTQEEFGKACRVAQPDVSRYELGHAGAPEDVLRRMAKVARIDWPLVVHLIQAYTSILAAAARGSAPPAAKALDITILEPVLLAVTPYLIKASTSELAPPSVEEERREAETIWTALAKHPAPFRRRLIEISPRCGSWALAVRICEESVKRAAHRPDEALELAYLALSIAERIPGPESWRSRVKAYCWAHVANALRVGNDHFGADEAFARAWGLWQAGAESDPEWLAEWRLFDLEASLRRAERRFKEALDLLDRARAASKADPLAAGRILLNREHVFEQMGDLQNALVALEEAAAFVEASGDARLVFALRFKTAHHLFYLERFQEASELLPIVREMALQQANDLDLIRVGWLTAKVAAGQGRTDEAIAGLEQVRRGFTARALPYYAALSSLDLAALWLKIGRTAEVKELAIAMGWIFKAKGIDREALAALQLFCDAARQESATVELARKVVVEIEKARRSAPAAP
jgi:transcriptional regulator with XRE-family HTH domain/tetratricopeptide (TPR) repeat protein